MVYESEPLPNFVYLGIAERDLEAAKYLLKNEFYPQAVFLVAQSVEKVVKSTGLWNRSITLAEAKKFSHKTYDLYAQVFDRLLAFVKSHPEDTEAVIIRRKHTINPKCEKIAEPGTL